jgi:hypothetical protein
MVPAVCGAFTTIVIVAVAPDASEPTLHVTLPEALVQGPRVELAETNVTPAGRVSVTTTAVAPFGPLLEAVTVYVIGVVAVAVAGAVLVIATSAFSGADDTLVVADDELLAVFGSGSFAVAVAVLVMVPIAVGVTVIVFVALAPDASEPTVHVTVPETLVHPGLAELNVTVAGSVSVTVTPVAGLGPLFLVLRV